MDLPSDMEAIYTRLVRRFFSAEQQKQISQANAIEASDNAILTFEVPNKEIAQLMYRRLQNAKVCGRRWKVQYMPLAATVPGTTACLVDCVLVPAGSRELVERSLGTVPGFLAFAEEDAEAGGGKEEARDHFMVSFVDEGSALHARAVLSGRLIGSSGVRMYLERRR